MSLDPTCTVDGCERTDIKRRGMCCMHARRVERHGNPHAVHAPHRGRVWPTVCAEYHCPKPVEIAGRCYTHHWNSRWPLPLPVIPDEAEPGWRNRAACAGESTEAWFPTPGRNPDPHAIELCARCPVRGDCLRAVLDLPAHLDAYGAFGGLPPGDRAKLRRQLQEEAA